MIRTIAILLATLAGLACASAVMAKGSKTEPFPVIQGYGTVKPLPASSPQPDKYKVHKVVFDLARAGDAGKVNDGLEAVALAVNAFASAGVSKKNLKFVVVIHGAATPIVIEGGDYNTRYNTANPNSDLIDKLTAAGVQLLVDGQSLADNHIESAEMNSKIDVTLSAVTALVIYQEHGYKLYLP